MSTTNPVRQQPRGRPLRQVIEHLTRKRARSALVLTAVAFLAYLLIPEDFRYVDALKEFVLVMGSVAAAAVFLPEISADLWTLNGDQVRRLVPDGQRRGLAKALVAADAPDPRWADLVLTEVFDPLVSAARTRGQIVFNMNYSVQVHVNKTIAVGEEEIEVHAVETSIASERALPVGNGSYWISVARRTEALRSEFSDSACLGRELVPIGDLTGQDWYDAVGQSCGVTVVINGQLQAIIVDPYDESSPDVVRWRFRPDMSSQDANALVPTKITFDFPLEQTHKQFPVMFSGYYCAGATVLTAKVYGDGLRDLDCDAFFGRGLNEHFDRNSVELAQGMLAHRLSFSTGRDSMLWPGSGLVFRWGLEDKRHAEGVGRNMVGG